MPNVNMVSFGPGQQDLQAQQLELQRRQALVDALRQQSMEAPQVQQMGPVASAMSPWQGVAKLAQAYFATKAQKQNDEKQLELGKESAARYAQALRESAPAGVFDDSGATPTGDLGSAPQMSQPSAQIDPSVKQAWVRALNTMMVDPEVGRKLWENAATLTPEQKNMAAMGQDPMLIGRLGTAAARKAGILELQPGTTSIDLSNGQERFQPKVGEGISLNNGMAQAIPGYAGANAEISGAAARANAAGQAGYDMVTVNTPAGPVMMTKEQAAQMSGGAKPIQFKASNGVSLNFQNKTPQQVYDAARASGDPQMMQAFQEWAQSGQQPMGIPLQSDAQREQQVGAVKNNLEIEKNLKLGAQSPEAQQKIADATGVLSLLDQAEPLINQATSSPGGVLRDKALGLVGASTPQSQAAAQLAAVGGMLVAKMPKMSGPQSDKDVQMYREMAGKLGDPTVPAGDKLAAAKVIRAINQKYLAENANSMPTKAYNTVKGQQGWSIQEVK